MHIDVALSRPLHDLPPPPEPGVDTAEQRHLVLNDDIAAPEKATERVHLKIGEVHVGRDEGEVGQDEVAAQVGHGPVAGSDSELVPRDDLRKCQCLCFFVS